MINYVLPYGLSLGQICGQGILTEDDRVFTGACKGDSGGPLVIRDRDTDTQIGIVNAGIGCGKGIPEWYTKISFYHEWIR